MFWIIGKTRLIDLVVVFILIAREESYCPRHVLVIVSGAAACHHVVGKHEVPRLSVAGAKRSICSRNRGFFGLERCIMDFQITRRRTFAGVQYNNMYWQFDKCLNIMSCLARICSTNLEPRRWQTFEDDCSFSTAI